MKKKEAIRYVWTANRIFLGLLMLLPGLVKLFVMGPAAIVGMLEGLGFVAPVFFAWVLIIAEIGTGLWILANKKLNYAIIAPIVILLIATFTAHWGNYANMLIHIVAITNYLMLGVDVHGSQA